MENLIISINCVLPVFMMICTGALIRIVYKVPKEVFDHLSTMCFRVLLPCMLFSNIYSADLSLAFDLKLLLFLAIAILVWFIIACSLSAVFESDLRTRGAYIQCFFRSNIGVVGVAMAHSMMDDAGIATVTIAVAVLAPLFNILAIIALERCRGGNVSVGETIRSILKNNIVRACVLGIVFLLLEIPIPSAIQQGLSRIGNAGSVMTMVALGAALRFDGMRQNIKKVAFASCIRLFVTPLVISTAAVLLGFRGNALGAVLLATASPMASTSYPMALACDSDHEFTGQILVATTFFCCLTLFLWIFAFKQLGLM